MSLTHETISVRQAGLDISIIDIEGDVTVAAEASLLEAHAEASERHARAIILNLSRMAYLNNSGIGLLVRLLIRANHQNQALLIWGLSEHDKQVFLRTRLSEALGIYASEQDALAAAHAALGATVGFIPPQSSAALAPATAIAATAIAAN